MSLQTRNSPFSHIVSICIKKTGKKSSNSFWSNFSFSASFSNSISESEESEESEPSFGSLAVLAIFAICALAVIFFFDVFSQFFYEDKIVFSSQDYKIKMAFDFPTMSAAWHRGNLEMRQAQEDMEAYEARRAQEQKQDEDFDSQATTQEYQVEQELADETEEDPIYSPPVSPLPTYSPTVAPQDPNPVPDNLPPLENVRPPQQLHDLTVSSDEEEVLEEREVIDLTVASHKKKRRRLTADQRYRKRKAYNKNYRKRVAAL